MENLTVKALAEELTEYFITNFESPAVALQWIENHPAKGWGWKLASIIDLQLNGIESWDSLTAEERQVIAKEIVKFLKEV
jgi:hypothetical protein